MGQIDARADTPLVNWSELGVSGLLPTGTVTLLLADVEGATRLRETQPEEMAAAMARLNEVVSDGIVSRDVPGTRRPSLHRGVNFGRHPHRTPRGPVAM